MTPIDSLKVGNWISVLGRADRDPRTVKGIITGGSPFRIRAISLPFICAQRDDLTISVDVRLYNVQRLTPRYARLMVDAIRLAEEEEMRRTMQRESIPQDISTVPG